MAELEDFHAEKAAQLSQMEAAEKMFRSMDEAEAQPPAKQGEEDDSVKPNPDDAGPATKVAMDLGEGFVEIPSQALGGVIDAANETVDMLSEFDTWIDDNVDEHAPYLKPLTYGPLDILQGDDDDIPDLPTTPEADSVTGGFVRNISKFVTGFVGAGKLKPLQTLRGLGTTGRIGADAIRGAISDFAVFDPHESRLSDLIQQYPALENPVTEYLAADPEDSKVEGRLKNAVEGLIPGVAADYLVEGFTQGMRALRGMRKAKDAAVKIDPVKQALDNTVAQRERVTELLGDPDAPKFEMRPIDVDASDLAEGGAKQDMYVNWARIDTPDDVKSVIQEMANQGKAGIDKARRGVVGWQQTKIDAEGMDAWQVLTERRKGQPLNNAETVAVRELWARSGSKLRDLTDQVVADPSEINKISFRKMLAIHNTIQEQVIAARTETARALNAWKIPAGSDVAFMGQMDQLRSHLLANDSTEAIAHGLKALTDAGMTKEADQLVYGSPWAKSADMVAQLWYFSLLSGPKTHMRNFIGNNATIGFEMLERKGASLLGQATGAQNVPDGEATAQMFGLVQGIKDAFRVSGKAQKAADAAGTTAHSPFVNAVLTGESGHGVGKVELPRIGAFSSEKLGLDKNSAPGRVMDWIDTATSIPGRSLAAADEVFKSANYRMELNARAFRQATEEGAEDIPARIQELVSNPEDAMHLAARSKAEVNTFTNTPLPTASWEVFDKVGHWPVLGKIILPFRRTPYNIATYTFSRTPLAPLVKGWRDDIMRGGADADIAWSKFLVGNSILLTMADLAMNGDITSDGPSNFNQRATARRSGVQPNSVRVPIGEDDEGNVIHRYFSYRSLEPLSTSMGIASNVVEVLEYTDWEDDNAEIDEMVIAASMAIASQVTSQSYMRGVSDFFEAMADPQRHGERWWARLAGAVVPTGVAEITRANDPYMRAANDIIDGVKARTPGLSKDLPHKRDAWGRPISRESGLGGFYDSVSPVYSRSEKQQPIDRELNRLELWVGKPPKRTGFDGVTVNMDRYPKEYDRWTQLQGQEVTETVHGAPISASGFVSSGENLMKELNMLARGAHPNYPKELYNMLTDGPDGGKAQLIRQVINAYRDAAKEHLLDESPKLRAEVDSRSLAKQGKYVFQ